MQVPSSANSMLGTALELGSSEPDPRQDPGAAGHHLLGDGSTKHLNDVPIDLLDLGEHGLLVICIGDVHVRLLEVRRLISTCEGNMVPQKALAHPWAWTLRQRLRPAMPSLHTCWPLLPMLMKRLNDVPIDLKDLEATWSPRPLHW